MANLHRRSLFTLPLFAAAMAAASPPASDNTERRRRPTSPTTAATGPDLSQYSLKFNADFSNTTRKWFTHDGGPFDTRMEKWGKLRTLPLNGEMQLYSDPYWIPNPAGTDSLGRNDAATGAPLGYNPFSFANGCLQITAIPVPGLMKKSGVDRAYLSGIIATDLSFLQRYGYFEICAQLPPGQGLWPTFWLASPTSSDEIDIVETIGGQTTIYQSIHLPANYHYLTNLVQTGFDYSAGFHTYGVLWTADSVVFYTDGRETTHANAPPMGQTPPLYVMVNLAVGGKPDWAGTPPPETQFPATLRIKYIRAHQQV
jgi:beta-glucanase (GH16 family)